jgi:hypothetical protein
VISQTLSHLLENPGAIQSPHVDQDEAMNLDRSTMILSSPMADTRRLDDSEADLDADDEDVKDAGSDEGIISSDDESIGRTKKAEVANEVPRSLELEPWTWANSLISAAETLVRDAIGVSDVSDDTISGVACTWRSGDEVWGASLAGEEGNQGGWTSP